MKEGARRSVSRGGRIPPVNLLLACGIAFTAVFLLLAVLAVLMRAITALFPLRTSRTDPAITAAIATAVAILAPGARVTRIEEEA